LNLAPKPAIRTRPAERKGDRYRQAVFAWNAAEQQIGQAILHARELPEAEMRFDDPKLVDFALRDLAALDPGDPRNRSLTDAAARLGLSKQQVESLGRIGVTDVRGLAEAINLAVIVERLTLRREAARALPSRAAGSVRTLEPPPPMSV